MSIEIEIKAWVDEFDTILEKLKEKYSFVGEYDKEDIYLKGIDSITDEEKEIRLRKVSDKFIVTYKDRSHQGKVEVNIEKEFEIDDKNNFLYVMEKLGYITYIRKSKKGYGFVSDVINIELSHVENLGDFIEIEYLAKNDSEVESAKIKIFSILDELRISREKIEDRFYVEMIMDK